MLKRIKNFHQLTGPEKQILFLAWRRLWQVRISLWFGSYKQTRSRIEDKINSSATKPNKSVSADGIAYLVTVVSRWVPSATCLTQALVGEWMLKEAGFNTSLHIGIKKGEDKEFEAHAWIELNGEKLLGGTVAEGFKPIYRE